MRLSLIMIAVLVTAPACVFDYPGWGDDDWGRTESNLSTSNPDMDGSIGDVQVSGEAWVESASSYDGYAHIDLRARGRGGVIMQAIDIDGLERLQIGDSYTVDGLGRYDDDAYPYVSVLGCSGPSNNNWDFDSTADEITVTVDPGPTADTMQVNVTATWDGYYDEPSQTVEGSIVVATY